MISRLPRAWRPASSALAAIVTLLVTALAQACPGCFQAKNDESRIAFIITTAFLTFLPLLLIGGLVLWLRVKHRATQQAAAEQVVAEPTPE